MKKEGKHSFVLINYFLLPLVFAPLVYCPVCVAALKTRLKNLIHILWEISWRHETCSNLPAWWLCFSSGFLFFPQGKCSQKSWSGFEFEELKLGFLLPSASQSGGFKTAVSGNRSASKFPNLSSLSGFEQPPIFNIVQCSQLHPILPKKAVLKSKIRVVKLCWSLLHWDSKSSKKCEIQQLCLWIPETKPRKLCQDKKKASSEFQKWQTSTAFSLDSVATWCKRALYAEILLYLDVLVPHPILFISNNW